RETVPDVNGSIERQLAALDLPEDAEEHGELHRRRGVEVVVGVVRPLDGRLAVIERDAEVLQLVLLLDFQHAAVKRDFRGGDRILLRYSRRHRLFTLQYECALPAVIFRSRATTCR